VKEKIKSLLAKLDPTRGPRDKLKSSVKKLIIAHLAATTAAGVAGGALGTFSASYLLKDKDKKKKK